MPDCFTRLTRRTLLALTAAAVALPMAAAPADADADERPELRIAFSDFPPLLEPLHPLSRRESGWNIMHNVFDALLDFEGATGFGLAPGIATSWRMVDDTTIEMKIRQGVTFHDGSPLTIQDVAFTFGPERMTGKDAPGLQQKTEYLTALNGIEVIDDETIHLTLSAPSPVILQQIATFGAQVIKKDAYLAAGSWEDWGRAPVGTGPYRVAEFRPDEFVRLEAHDAYWGGRPPAKAITIYYVPEEAVRVAGLVSGTYDIITNVTLDQVPVVEKANGVEIVGGEIADIRGIYFDTTHPQLADARVRRAMSHAIDRELIVESMWNGMLTVPKGMQTPAFGDMYIDDHATTGYDPKAARDLLTKAGYAGAPIPLRIKSGDSYPAEKATAEVLVQMWRAVGINVQIEMVENWPQVWERPGTGMRNASSGMMYPDPLSQLWRRHGRNGWTAHYGWWKNEEFFKLGDILQTSTDLDERRRVFARMLEITEQDPPGIVIHTETAFYGVRSGVKWRPYASQRMDFRARNLAFGG